MGESNLDEFELGVKWAFVGSCLLKSEGQWVALGSSLLGATGAVVIWLMDWFALIRFV